MLHRWQAFAGTLPRALDLSRASVGPSARGCSPQCIPFVAGPDRKIPIEKTNRVTPARGELRRDRPGVDSLKFGSTRPDNVRFVARRPAWLSAGRDLRTVVRPEASYLQGGTSSPSRR